MTLWRLGLALAVGLTIAAAAPAQAESNGGVRVMPLGDSITDGWNVPVVASNGSIVNASGRCVDVPYIDNGTPVQLHRCDGTGAQHWSAR